MPDSKSIWWLYVLACRDGTLYTGVTTDVARRFKQHVAGKASRYTRSRLPVTLIHQERCADRSSALKKEHALKSLPRAQKEEYLKAHARNV